MSVGDVDFLNTRKYLRLFDDLPECSMFSVQNENMSVLCLALDVEQHGFLSDRYCLFNLSMW